MIRIISFDYDGVFLYYYNVNPVKVYTSLLVLVMLKDKIGNEYKQIKWKSYLNIYWIESTLSNRKAKWKYSHQKIVN